jgi:hypothetical protein
MGRKTTLKYIRKKMTLRFVGRKNTLKNMRRKTTKIYARRKITLRRKEDDSDICRVEEEELGGIEDDRKDTLAGESETTLKR